MSLISVSVSRTSLGLVPLVFGDSRGAAITIMPGWSFGDDDAENEYATSADIPGASVARTHIPMSEIVLPIVIRTTSLAALETTYTAVVAAIRQAPSFDVTRTLGGTVIRTYSCAPGRASRDWDKFRLLKGEDKVTLTIPRQP